MENFGIAHALLQLLLLHLVGSGRGDLLSGQPGIDLRIQAREQLISQTNDSVYVQRIMRLCKSAEMRSYMQQDTDACDNFYEYSCGNWPQINPANDAYPRETNFEQLLVKTYRHKQQRLMEQPANEETDEVAVLRVKDFYASCLLFRQAAVDSYRLQLQEIVAEFGRMPVLSLPGQEWPAEEFDWQDTVAQIKRQYGFDILLLFQQSADRIYAGQPKQILPKSNRKAVAEDIANHLEHHLGVDPKLAATTAREITEFEHKIAAIMVDRRVGVMSKLHTQNVTDYSDVANLTQYVETVLDRELKANESLYEHVPGYLIKLLDLVEVTPPHVLANYVFNELLKHFYYERAESVVEQCVSRVRDLFAELLDNMVFKQYGDEGTMKDIDSVWQQVQRSFRGVLQNSSADWLVPETREQLLDQLNTTSLVINGYAEVNFTQRYEKLQLKPRDYLHNLRTILHHQSLRVKVKTQTSVTYDPMGKRVLFPVALLQPNFLWSRYYPKAVRYGSLGTLLAQQLAHSLEDASKWDAKSFAEYSKRKSCFKEQYARLRLNGQYWPESDLQAENIADNLAIQVAYHAYRRLLADLDPSFLGSESLPLLNLGSRRLFFLSFAQLWCNDANEQFRDKHSLLLGTPNALRVLGALSNFRAFGRDFNCGSASRMTSSQKCQLFTVSLD
ncbi:neprilysin-4 [Drosophila erecta]|uniref:neprilysin-4 n=1 Tax=Drosophila erecta TaxID=7220 RepID=UPI000732927F|nr:neprilysin-4 [Drosophila erecta]KQS52122.1 uncharacterized protein Dere_GG26965 [Drosophila erecta]